MFDFNFIFVVLVSFLIGLFITKPVLALLYKLKLGQKILEDTPESHRKKAGTPTMGGIIIILATLIPFLIIFFCGFRSNSLLRSLVVLVYALCIAIVGAIDDYLTVFPKNGVRGIKSGPKAFIQIVITLCFCAFLAFYLHRSFNIFGLHLTGIFYTILVTIIMSGFLNFVNLTDGLDGLLGGTCAMIALGFGVAMNSVLLLCLGGAALGFLVTNCNVAKVFMGDTGSLFIGALFAGFGFINEIPWIMFIASSWFIIEGFSVMIQWAWFKYTRIKFGEGRRVFKKAPIHHHFEECGYPEQKITVNVWIFTLFCVSIAGYVLSLF